MSGGFLRLYEKDTQADGAFLLEEGEAVFYINTGDKYALSGRGIIIGSLEPILSGELGIASPRTETALIKEGSSVKKISIEKFTQGLDSFPFLLNVSMVLAKQLALTNQLVSKNQTALTGKDDDRKKLCLSYYKIVKEISAEYAKRKLPWLKDTVTKHEMSLIYKEGEALSRTAEPVTIQSSQALNEQITEYAKDSMLCEEGESGSEMFILQSGMIDVIIKGKSVAQITEPGTPIGEIALLIGEKRTATLKAKNTVIAAKILKQDLAKIAEKDISVIRNITLSLAKKQYQNINKIVSLSNTVTEKEMASTQETRSREAMKLSSISSGLAALKNEISELVFKKREPFLKEIADRHGID